MNATWRPIPTHPHYLISDDGRVLTPRKKILKPWRGRGGYHRVDLMCEGVRTTHAVHRLVLEAFVGPCPEGYQGAHGDGDVSNNHLKNLRWATPGENAADRDAHGRTARGERQGNAVLTEGVVIMARSLARRGFSQRRIADLLGHPRTTVADAIRGVTWGHVTEWAPPSALL